MRKGPFREGEPVILFDRRLRRYMVSLRRGGVTDLRGGKLFHDEIIGREEGEILSSTLGERFLVFRPTLSEYILEMPRGAQVIYPKDLGIILMWADIFPGAVVVEAGTGSGALTMALIRAVGPSGKVISYEVREDFARRALRNIDAFLGPVENLELRHADIYEGIPEREVDRILLDLPEPWQVVPHAARSLRPGGIFLSYLPTVVQVQQLVEALQTSGAFTLVETIEAMVRPWNVSGRSVRPEHRMVAHTGFITTARKLHLPQ